MAFCGVACILLLSRVRVNEDDRASSSDFMTIEFDLACSESFKMLAFRTFFLCLVNHFFSRSGSVIIFAAS